MCVYIYIYIYMYTDEGGQRRLVARSLRQEASAQVHAPAGGSDPKTLNLEP